MSETYFRELISQTEAGDYEKEDIWYRWKVSIPWEVLKERSERQYPQIGTFTGLAIQERNPGGGVKMLEIQADKQSVTLENEYAIRKFLSVKGLSIIRNDGSTCNTMEQLPSACFVIDTGNEQGIEFVGIYRWRLWAWRGDESERSKASCGRRNGLAGDPAGFLSEYYDRKLAWISEKIV